MKRKPTHPGEILERRVLPRLDISLSRFAEILGLSRQHVHRILTGESPVTADTAVLLGALLGTEPRFWLNLQDAHDIWRAQQENADQIKRIVRARAEIHVQDSFASPTLAESKVSFASNG